MVSSALIKVDRYCDYVPGISAVNNSVNIVIKLVLCILKCIIPRLYRAIKDNRYIAYIENKNCCLCIILTIPILNICVATIYHTPERLKSWAMPKPNVIEEAADLVQARADAAAAAAKEINRKLDRQQKIDQLEALKKDHEAKLKILQGQIDAASENEKPNLQLDYDVEKAMGNLQIAALQGQIDAL